MWWGLNDCIIPMCELDVRPGGRWRIDMQTPDGTVYRNQGEYIVVEPYRRLVYSDIPDHATTEWEGRVPGQRENQVTFAPEGNRTCVTLTINFATAEDRERFLGFGIDRGIEQSLDKLEALIASLGSDAASCSSQGDATHADAPHN
jgi:uncharacterized protein YndB with AHSA1/START domain